jgi:crossover junction endodeoxyribonuclease RuvC
MTENKVVVGIDPGLTGAIATYFSEGKTLFVRDMPTVKVRGKLRIDYDALIDLLADELAFADRVVIERVSPMPGGQGIASTASFIRGAGFLTGAAKMFARLIGDFEVVEVAPAQWKLETGIRVPVKATRAQRKTASRERAMLLLPNHADLFARVKDDGRAEASLLALWGCGRPCPDA